MRMLEVHTCPIWEDPNGSRRPGIEPEDDHPPVVGWCNVAVLDLDGESCRLLLTLEASE